MKSITRREIHEQKCPDRLKKQNEYKLCPYNPYHYVRNESYEKHIKDCKDKPKISFQEEDKEKAKALDDIISEQEQIKYARMKYYKDCIQEPKIVGISDKNMKKNKIKKEKIIKNKFKKVNEKEGNHIASLADADFEQENNGNEIQNFEADADFESEKIEIDNKNNVLYYKYNPNDEDKDIGKFSANIIDANEINEILNSSD
jgi:hypothetical protein